MGKTQSKRSVDITTEAKKNPDEDVTGKLEKIEDLDQKQVNGDASSQENVETEALQKKDGDETENDKDLTTEKSGADSGAQDGGGDSNTAQSNASAAESATKEEETTLPKDDNKSTEEISPLSDENSKKPKKEKVKKKWSFRSISFGKKDKQKPAKADDAATENAAATNGDTTAQVGDGAATEETAEKVQKDEAAGDSEEKNTNEKPNENGESSEKELNGEKTSTSTTPTEEQPTKEISSNENTTNITNNTTETKSSVVIENSSTTATENNQTEKHPTTTATNLAAETPESAPAVLSNGDAIENNGTETLSTTDDQKDQVIDKAVDLMGETSDVAEKIKTIPNVVNEMADNKGVHQNGTSANGEELETENESKSQVEVIFQTDKAALTDELVTLNTATTSSSPKTTPILIPVPTDITETTLNEISEKVEINKEGMITDLTEKQLDEAVVITADCASSVAVDVASKAVESASTSTVSVTEQTEIANVDAGNVEPNELEAPVDTPADQLLTENESENKSEDLTTAVSATSTATESPKPPPLPVSPPPSQVSVFAFNDNNQVEEEGICDPSTHNDAENKTSEPSIPAILQQKDLDDIPNTQPCTEELQPCIDDPQPKTEDPQPCEEGSQLCTEDQQNCPEEQQLCTEDSQLPIEETINNDDTNTDTAFSSEEIAPVTSAQNVECESNTDTINTNTIDVTEQCQVSDAPVTATNTADVAEQCQDSDVEVEEILNNPLAVEKDDIISEISPNSTEEVVREPQQSIDNTEDQFVMAATAVVDEITEKAVELIKQQKDNEEHQPNINEPNEIITTNEDIKTENDDVEMKASEEGIENDGVSVDKKGVSMEELIEKMESSNINCEDINADKHTQLTIESHLHDSLKATDKHIVEEEKVFDTQMYDQAVDITNAKDLKESAAAEVTTQDLPVICE